MSDAAFIYGPDATRLPPTTAPYVAWTGHPRPRAEDCGDPRCREAREHAWAVADAAYDRESKARRYADDVEWELACARRELSAIKRAEGSAL